MGYMLFVHMGCFASLCFGSDFLICHVGRNGNEMNFKCIVVWFIVLIVRFH